MQDFNSSYFTYKNSGLFCENTPIKKIIEEVGTPAYIYSKKFFIDRYEEFNNAFKDIPHTIFFAAKSNFNINVIKTFVDLGSGVDVNSEGELKRAILAGAKPEKLILTGVGKSINEIRLGLQKDLLMIKAESEEELELINTIAGEMNRTARVAIRVNPDVDAQSHPYISTGLSENKFGVDAKSAIALFKDRNRFKHIKFTGIDMHIGSQITSINPFAEAVEKLSQIYSELKNSGLQLEHFDVGGGVGVQYGKEEVFSVGEYAKAILPILKKLNCDIFFEPGRFLTANGGILAAQILFTKKNGDKNFLITDAAMNDLLRPSIYGAHHHIQPIKIYSDRTEIMADIVGPVCESGDFLGRKRKIQESKRGEYIAVMSAGAYGMVMASNYNARRRPPEILVDGDKFYVIRSRETYDHLLFDERIVA
ncbi:MAG: diaminopimelate decarboxylase [Ignavibacteriaceae bacterium]|nr:diaminopimelate decarboxylase [Ignavibacteriaceae bacterium]